MFKKKEAVKFYRLFCKNCRYLLYLKNPNIEKTSNKLDNYYRNTNPKIIKTRYKTRKGILSYLYYQMIEWTDKKEKNILSL